jgi:hypothetical protein
MPLGRTDTHGCNDSAKGAKNAGGSREPWYINTATNQSVSQSGQSIATVTNISRQLSVASRQSVRSHGTCRDHHMVPASKSMPTPMTEPALNAKGSGMPADCAFAFIFAASAVIISDDDAAAVAGTADAPKPDSPG